MALRDRIVDFRRVSASTLRANPKNWRRHPDSQRRALQAVLDSVGIADALIAYETPDGLTLIDGHLRQDMTGDQEMPVLVLDLTDAEADTVLATLDPLAAMAEADKDALLALMSSIETDNADLMGLFEALANDERLPMPDFQPTDSESQSRLDQAVPITCPECGHEFAA